MLAGLGCAAMGLLLLVARGAEPGGIEEVWLLLGPPDLGAVDFPTLRRARLPIDALACPPEHCRNAVPDLVPPLLPVSGERLRAIVAEVATEMPGTEPVFQARWAEEDRYVTRSFWLRLPDTINVAIIGAGEERSTLALYSRSQVALHDLGGNRARLVRWLERIAAKARTP
ncbi:DUF1499 domain-containing protein [Methylobacterium durans]|uniref:DUF1499 domain-containing protein n=1 Tax=Methylobacterium durans TaxID=2202825 RepID=A0A2U8W4Z0_9HYPH|nr:DUF1499 domain-containing protein [Methylobacterium durans]AWN41175.1 hypothetical protein DK389_12380 [Methylobacterium durans]